MRSTAGERPERADGTRRRWVVHARWLLALPLVGVLIPPLYNARSPELLGMPFFYWYQIAWVPISACCTAIACRALRGGGDSTEEREL